MIIKDEHYRVALDRLHEGVFIVNSDMTLCYWNDAAEKITGFTKDEIINSKCKKDILNYLDENGKRLYTQQRKVVDSRKSGDASETKVFIQHKHGHRIPVIARVTPINDSNGEMVGAIETFLDISAQTAARESAEMMRSIAMKDPITHLGNRQYTETIINGRLEEMRRYNRKFGILYLDLDRFKVINEQHGLATGDRIMHVTGKNITSCLRPFDYVGRWGGAEFVAMVVNVKQKEIEFIAERIRAMIENSNLNIDGKSVCLTISIGAAKARLGDSADSLIRRAGKLMFVSKKKGRNRVTAENEDIDRFSDQPVF